MEEKDPKIAAIYPDGQDVPGTAVLLGNYGLFLPHRPHAGTLSGSNAFTPEAVEEIARFLGRSAQETAWFLNRSAQSATSHQSSDRDQDTRSGLGKAVRCGKYSLSLPDGAGPEAVDALDEEQLEEVVGFFQAALGSIGGRIGGRSRSEAKIAAARKNGKRGGRPKGSKNKFGREKEKQRNAMEGRIEVRRVDE